MSPNKIVEKGRGGKLRKSKTDPRRQDTFQIPIEYQEQKGARQKTREEQGDDDNSAESNRSDRMVA